MKNSVCRVFGSHVGGEAAIVPPALIGGLNTKSLSGVLSNPVAWVASVDYVTMTQCSNVLVTPDGDIVPGQDRKIWDDLRRFWVERLSVDDFGYVNEPKPWAANGYEGYLYADQVVFAVNLKTDSVLVRASGSIAYEVFMDFAPFATNCSRIDIQVTTWFRCRVSTLAVRCFNDLRVKRKNFVGRGRGRVAKFHLHLDQDYGSTLELGVRKSRAFARLYDKSRDPKLQGNEKLYYARSWRYELELKDEYSSGFLEQYQANLAADKDYELPAEVVADTVLSWFDHQGVRTPPVVALATAKYKLLQKRHTGGNVYRQLLWLSKQVAPTLRKLMAYGYRLEAFSVLGLAHVDALHEAGWEQQFPPFAPSYYVNPDIPQGLGVFFRPVQT